jgi:hypothetical protein
MANTARQRTMATGLVIGVAVLTGRAGIASEAPMAGLVHRTGHAESSANRLPRAVAPGAVPQDPQNVGIVFSGASPLSATVAGAPRIPRVRANADAVIAALLLEAPRQSVTFHRLVEAIDASDGIVYVEHGRCGHHVRACLALIVRVAGPNRILRIVVNTRSDHDELIASIGHELQHAAEALSDRHVTSNSTMYFFFERMARSELGSFETDAAIQAGLAVMTELRAKVH